MPKCTATLIQLTLLVTSILVTTTSASGFTTNQNPSIVIAQSNSLGPTRNGIVEPEGEPASDRVGNLWVADTGNNRVLAFAPPFTTNMSASLVVGQRDLWSNASKASASTLYAPYGTAFDAEGNLWVADAGNNRVLTFEPPFHNGMDASIVIGQRDFTGNSFNTTRSGLSGPGGLAFDAAWLMRAYGRVLGFDAHDHSVMTGTGRAHLKNSAGLLTPLTWIPTGNAPIATLGWLTFPDGLFNFTIQGLNSTTSVTLTLTFPQPLPMGTEWWSIHSGEWTRLPPNQVLVNGTNLNLTLNGASLTGVISMIGGPAVAPNITSSSNTSTNATTPSMRYRKHMRR